MSTHTLTLDVDTVSAKLAAAAGIIDLIVTLAWTGDMESLCEHSLSESISTAMDMIGEARQLLAGTSREVRLR